ncbi:MAG: type 1 glutamine amidotransferase [Verrucomicrobia bacterium]|nr:type 1 glutamine amidotransferase [Verrucomicrobiota bacterium]MBV9673373.1 type 1 glutamine amidotransferase [Verrucomicrobiota bacterium]
MPNNLNNLRVAILVANGFEQVELEKPKKALDEAGAKTFIISIEKDKVKAWNVSDWGDKFHVDLQIAEANVSLYDALLLPGGVMNPDYLRVDSKAVAFVKSFLESGKPIAAICHGPWTLVEADGVKGKTLTSWPSLRTDIQNAGGTWVDQEVVTDNGLVTSRKPADIPAFNRKMLEEFAEGTHARETSIKHG